MRCCDTCDYSVAVEDEDGITLECRRHAIKAVGLDDEGNVVCAFPVCEPTMWCGDYTYTPKLNVRIGQNYCVDYSMWEGL